MKHDALVGAMYGLIVPFVMPFVAFLTRKVNYLVFFMVGSLGIPTFAFMSVGVRQGWSIAITDVFPRILNTEGMLIVFGLGAATVVLVWIARFSGFERTTNKSEGKHNTNKKHVVR